MKKIDLIPLVEAERTVNKRINIARIIAGENGSHYYRDMKPEFLQEIQQLTGSPYGMDYAGTRMRFWIHPDCAFIDVFLLAFDRHTGEYIGLEDIFFRDISNIATVDEIQETPRQVKAATDRFIEKALNLNFM